MISNPLAGFGVKRFLREHWQKKPLILRAVAPQLATALGRADLIDLACRDDVESRLIIGSGRSWTVQHGPFQRRDFSKLPAEKWTLLVNGIETVVPAAAALQLDFGFIPGARHDDVMVSYAAPGGGVGPHFDSYDVFLLQGAGTRRWRLANQRDLSLIEGAPLKILRHFRAQQDLHMQAGDLIYLPPGYAHHGTAVGECLTWSVGMRAPHRRELTARFLDYLQDRACADDVYRDPALKPQAHRAEIGPHMRKAARDMIGLLRWRDADIDRCFGEMLSEPRQNVVFDPPPRGSEQVFARRCRARGLELDLKSRMLFDHRNLYINGEATALRGHDAAVLRQLADQRALPPGIELATATRALLYRWYCAGYLAPPA